MKHDIKNIDYHLTKAQELKQQQEEEKKLLKQLKKDIKTIFFTIIKTKKLSLYELINNKEDIIEDIFYHIRDLEEEETTEYFSGKETKIYKRYEKIEDLVIYEEIEEEYYKLYKQYKSIKNEENNLKTKKQEENTKKSIENKVYDYYIYLNNKGYSKQVIEITITDSTNDILNELGLVRNEENELIIYKEIKKLKSTIPTKYVEKKKSRIKIPLGWKCYLGLTALEKIKKHF